MATCIAVVAAVALGAGTGRPAEPAPTAPRLVVLYATCSVNKDYLAPYAPTVRFTPHLDRFAREGVVFARHHTEAGQSGIAYASIFTGTQADRHGIFNHPNRLRDEALVIGEAFRDAGYDTYYWGRHAMAAPELNYGQGVRAAHSFGPQSGRHAVAEGDQHFEAMLERLRREPDSRAFAMVTFSVTHSPYLSKKPRKGEQELRRFTDRFPEEAAGMELGDVLRHYALYHGRRLELQWDFPATVARLGLTSEQVAALAASVELTYKSRIHLLDRLFGRLLEKIQAAGLARQALIVFTADHGEVLYRPNALYQWSHGLQLAPEVLHVPMIVRLPGTAPRPRAYARVTRSIDVFPTVAGLAGVPVPPGAVDGADLSAAVLGRAPEPRLLAFSHTTVPLEQHARPGMPWALRRTFFPTSDVTHVWVQVRDHDWVFKHRKLDAERWATQAFDLARDPTQATDVFDPADPAHAAMAARLVDYKTRLHARYAELASDGQLPDAETRARLEALGYVDPDVPAPSPSASP